MTVVAIRCPSCGSAAASTSNANEWVCSHCQTRFQITRPADGTVITDAKAHHCPICGRPVQVIQSYKCTECGRLDFCESCVTAVPNLGAERFVCRSCVHNKKWNCAICGNYGATTCIACSRRACQEHDAKLFAYSIGSDTIILNCISCAGQVCADCAEPRRRFIRTRFYCNKCRNKLNTTVVGSVATKKRDFVLDLFGEMSSE